MEVNELGLKIKMFQESISSRTGLLEKL